MAKNDSRKFLTVTITTPETFDLKFDREATLKVVGQKLADDSRKAIRSGTSRDGKALPVRKTDENKKALIDSGRMVRDVRYDKKSKQVMPSTYYRTDVSKRARNSFGLLKIHVREADFYRNEILDPLGTLDPKLPETASKYAQQALNNQAEHGKLTLKGVGKRRKKKIV